MKIIQVVYQNALSHSIKIAKLVKWNRFLGGNKDERFHEISVFFRISGGSCWLWWARNVIDRN